MKFERKLQIKIAFGYVVMLAIGISMAFILVHERKRMKNVQIPYDLFVALVEYHLGYDDEYEDEIRQGLERKLDAMMRHELYAKYKTAPSAEEREQARQEYLDRRGIFPGFRW